MFVVLMKRLQWGVDPKVPQQFACGAGVLGQDEMRLLKHLQRPGVMSPKFPTGVGTTTNVPPLMKRKCA